MQAVVQHRRGIPLGPGARREVPGLCRVRRANGGAVALAYSPAMPETPPNPGSDPLPQARPGARRLRTAAALAGLLAVALAPAAPAQDTRDDARLRAAIQDAERGRFDAAAHAGLRGHPAFGWVEYAALQRDLDTLAPQRGLDFLARYRGQAVAGTFRRQWLASLGRRGDWTTFRSAWDEAVDDTALRCYSLQARNAAGTLDEASVQAARAIWIAGDGSLPAACDPVFAALDARGALGPALRWERLEKAAAAWEPGVMRVAARGLPEPERALAEDYAAFVESVHERALAWPKNDRSRRIAAHGLAKLGKDDPDRAESLLPRYASALGMTEAERGIVLYQVALWTVASYLPDSARRLNLVPESAYDDRLHEWRVREAMARSDWPAALAAIRRMGAAQRADSRWTYFEGRLAELTGDPVTARAKYEAAAREPQFHGFLAADRIGRPYALCPLEPPANPALRAEVARDPAIVRAMALYRVDRPSWAVREWQDALSRFDDARRQLAVAIAQDNRWYDRAVFSLGRDKPEELRLYTLRFPLHHENLIRRESARNGLDPAFVAAEIRAESTFNPAARSPADARGLMQVIPSTGAAVSRRLGRTWTGPASLYNPETNIVLGTAYLRQLLDEYGPYYFAIAGYNAGPAPLARWKSQRPGMDPDFWIETISYRETREYVARVLAFSVIYDWRLNGDALPVSDRMQARTGVPRKRFDCPA
jgi:soluble lytic murein transglycosylase